MHTMSLPFIACGILAFVGLVLIAERWSIVAAGVLVLIVGALLACSSGVA